MTNMEVRALENAHRGVMLWTEGYDGQTHHAAVLKALLPALLILAMSAALMLAMF